MKTNLVKPLVFTLIGLLVLGLAFLFVTRYAYKGKATAGQVVMSLNINPLSIPLNGVVDIPIMFTGGVGDLVSGATVAVMYEKSFFTYVGTDSAAPCDGLDTEVSVTDTDISPQPPGTTVPMRQITWTKIAVKPSNQLPSGLFCFGKLRLKGVTAGTTTITAILATSSTAPIVGPQPLTLSIDPSKNITPVTVLGSVGVTPGTGDPVLNFQVKLQGILGKPTNVPSLLTRITVAKIDGSFTRVFDKVTITPNDNGVWDGTVTLLGVPAGSGYRILVKGPKHLQRKFCDFVPVPTENGAYICGTSTVTLVAGNNEADFTKVPLLVGDLPPQDGLLNAFDAAQMRVNLLLPGVEAANIADLNYDGVVNSTDYSLLIQSMQLKYDEEQ